MIKLAKKIFFLAALIIAGFFGVQKTHAAITLGAGPDNSTNGVFIATSTDSTDFRLEGTGVSTLINYRVGFGPAINLYATSTATSSLTGMSVINSVSFIARSSNNSAHTINLVVNCIDGTGSHSGGPLSNTMSTPADQSTNSFNAQMATPITCDVNTFQSLKLTFTVDSNNGTDGLGFFGTNNGFLTNGFGYLNTSGVFYENYEMYIGINTSFNARASALDTPGLAELKLGTTWPFSYFFDIKDLISNASSTTASVTPVTLSIPFTDNATTTFTIFSEDQLHRYMSNSQLAFLKQVIGWTMWLSFLTYIFYRIKSFWQNAEPEE